MRAAPDEPGTFQGSIWLMARGEYSVDVTLDGARGRGVVRVPVAAVATGRLAMNGALTAILAALGLFLVAGLVTIVYKAAGESLVELGQKIEDTRRRRARRVAAFALPVLALALFGGARWWRAVDRDYAHTIYQPRALAVSLNGAELRVQMGDTMWQNGPGGMRASHLVADHGKLMHLFLVKAEDASAFAHLHPQPLDSSAFPVFSSQLPPLPSGRYQLFADVVHETGQERTLVGTLDLDSAAPARARSGAPRADADDAWHVGDATRDRSMTLPDGATMTLELVPNHLIHAETEEMITVAVRERDGSPATLEPYLGMAAHAVVVRTDGSVFVHLHPMGTMAMASQQAFDARDRGDTTADGRLRLPTRTDSSIPAMGSAQSMSSSVQFPYLFPKGGSYRVFVQVRHKGVVQTGAFALTVAEPALPTR
jgi:hypothetical protein